MTQLLLGGFLIDNYSNAWLIHAINDTLIVIHYVVPSSDRNIIEAACSGASQAIFLVANVAVSIITFVSILHFINATLAWFGHRVGLIQPEYQDLTLEVRILHDDSYLNIRAVNQ